MAVDAIDLKDSAAAFVYLNGLVEILESKGLGVPITGVGLSQMLAHKLVRKVAIDTIDISMLGIREPSGNVR